MSDSINPNQRIAGRTIKEVSLLPIQSPDDPNHVMRVTFTDGSTLWLHGVNASNLTDINGWSYLWPAPRPPDPLQASRAPAEQPGDLFAEVRVFRITGDPAKSDDVVRFVGPLRNEPGWEAQLGDPICGPGGEKYFSVKIVTG